MVSIPESIYSLLVNFHTNPSPNPTLTLSSHLRPNVRLGKGWVGGYPAESTAHNARKYSHLPLPSSNVNTSFSLRPQGLVGGGVCGQLPRLYTLIAKYSFLPRIPPNVNDSLVLGSGSIPCAPHPPLLSFSTAFL